VGYIRLKQFNANASKECAPRSFRPWRVRGWQGYVSDLRSNPGLLDASVEIGSASGSMSGIIVLHCRTRDGIPGCSSGPTVGRCKVARGGSGQRRVQPVQRNSSSGALAGQTSGGVAGWPENLRKGLFQSVRGLSDGTSGMTVDDRQYLTRSGATSTRHGIRRMWSVKMKRERDSRSPTRRHRHPQRQSVQGRQKPSGQTAQNASAQALQQVPINPTSAKPFLPHSKSLKLRVLRLFAWRSSPRHSRLPESS